MPNCTVATPMSATIDRNNSWQVIMAREPTSNNQKPTPGNQKIIPDS